MQQKYSITMKYIFLFLVVIAMSLRSGSLLAEPRVSTDKNTYQPGEPIQVHFSGAPGSNRDWICIVSAAAPDTDGGNYQYIPQGQSEGNLTFTSQRPGNYEVRAYYDYSRKGYVVSARQPFKVGRESSAPGVTSESPASETVQDDSGLGTGYLVSELSGAAKPAGGITESIPTTKKYRASHSVLWKAVQDVLDEQGYFFSADSSSGRIKTDPRVLGKVPEGLVLFEVVYSAVASIKVDGSSVSFRARFNKQSNIDISRTLIEYPEKENALRKEFFDALDAKLAK